MQILNLSESYDAKFVEDVERESEQNISLCYQCGNCTAGCPYTFAYDIPVSQVMRLIQAGQKKTLLSCKSIWLCATCESCTTRCPNEIDVARVMDVLRHMARREGYAAEKNVKIFWDNFLSSVRRHGRVFEMGLMASYALKSGDFFSQADLGPKMLPKNKLGLRPHDIKGKAEVDKIFQRFKEQSS
jgi:heterodisulfide reductase subunit C